MDTQRLINTVYNTVLNGENPGHVADYIAELKKVNPNKFGVSLTTLDQKTYSAGDFDDKFSIQSISKVLSLAMAFNILDKKLWERVGVEASGSTFNSLVQLELENGIPRNPLINAGAIVICDILVSELEHPKEDFISYLRTILGDEDINYSSAVATSEWKEGYRNFALANLLKSFDNIKNGVHEVLDFYFHLSSITMTCSQLSRMFLFMANGGTSPSTKNRILTLSKTKRINAIMQICGFYDEAGEFAFKVGLPGKSGVGGGIVAIMPNQYAVAVWSPRLNPKGNSYRGMKFLEELTTLSENSIF